MRLEDCLQIVRDDYVGFFRAKVAELKQEHPTCVAELLVQPNGAQNPPPFSLLRVDAIYGSAASPTAVRFAFPALSKFRDVDCEHGSVRIHFDALSWEHATVSFEAPNFDLARLGGWLSRWIDDAGARSADDSGLAGVLHSIAWNSMAGGLWEITVDFGSAPVTCAAELVDALQQQGVAECYFDSDEEEG